jgi:1,2-phenylacetyl-CoA epoxidase PaaB subunit
MMQRSPTQTKAESSFTAIQTGLVQRKCTSCGQHTIAGGECAECKNRRSPLQRRSTNQAEPSEVPSIIHEVLRSPGQPLDQIPPAFKESRFTQDFKQVQMHGSLVPVLQPKLAVNPARDKYEQEADRISAVVVSQINASENKAFQYQQKIPELENQEKNLPQQSVQHQHSGTALAPDLESSIQQARGHGYPIAAHIRKPIEKAFGTDFSRVKVHTDAQSDQLNHSLNALAFTNRQDIFFRAGAYNPGTKQGQELLAHELTHVVQQAGGVQRQPSVGQPQHRHENWLQSNPVIDLITSAPTDTLSMRRATWLERRAWLSFFSHYLPRKLLNNYMDDTGAEIRLTQQEMIDCNPIVDLRNSPAFLQEVGSLPAAGGGTKNISVSGAGGALTNGTLGNFTINYTGQLTITPYSNWQFNGTMNFYDYWNFDPKPFGSGSGRPIPAEIKVRVAASGIPGRPFDVRSVDVPVSQTKFDGSATWVDENPTPVKERLARTAADIEVGAGVGDVGGGEIGARGGYLGTDVGAGVGDVGGGEIGAQSAEDLN